MRSIKSPSISFSGYFSEFKDYTFTSFRLDFLAAIAVALLTIPQSIAYSILAGLPPTAGLFSAIFGTIFTGAIGSSRMLISGPSTGVAILIQTSIADILYTSYSTIEGPAKEVLVLHLLTQIVVLIGFIQIIAAFCNVSKLLQFVSRPVMLGYFAGITVAVLVGQIYNLLGVTSPPGDEPIFYRALLIFSTLLDINFYAFIVGILTFIVLVFFRKNFKNWPDALFALVSASLLAKGFNYLGEEQIVTLGDLHMSASPSFQSALPLIDFKIISKIFPVATAIAFLAILEVFSLSRNFSSQNQQKMQGNRDVLGVGVGNLVLSFISGAMSCSGSATRSALNYRMNAQSRLSSILSGILTAILIYFCWPLVRHIPLSGLAAVLIATVPTITNWKEVKLSFRATREDAWVFILTFFSCLIFSLDIAFYIGIAISLATFLKKSAEPHLVEYAFNSKGRLTVISPHADVHRKIRIIGIGGELYFAAADFLQNSLSSIAEDPNVQAIVLRLNNVYHIDASMCLAIIRVHDILKSSNRYLLISGLTEEVWHIFHRVSLVKQIGLDNLYFTDESNPQFSTWKACLRAQELIHK